MIDFENCDIDELYEYVEEVKEKVSLKWLLKSIVFSILIGSLILFYFNQIDLILGLIFNG